MTENSSALREPADAGGRPNGMRRLFPLRVNRLAALAAVAALTLAACGGADDDVGGADDAPIDTAASTTVGSDGDGLRAPEPVEVVSGGGGDGALGATAETSSLDVATSDMRIDPRSVEYVLGDGDLTLPTDDTGYVFDAATEPSADDAARIAAAFGVDGEPVLVDQGFTSSWRVGPEDGSTPTVWVNDDAQLSWNYNAPWLAEAAVEPCVLTTDPDGTQRETCEEPTPPTGVPTADEAEQRAREILTALGTDVDGLTFETYADEWFASVSATVDVGGRTDHTRWWNFGFGGEGVLQYAGGSLAEPEAVGPYPLVDLDTAVDRLREGFFGGFGGFGGIAETAVAETVAVESVDGEPVEPADSGVAEEPPVDTLAPAETMPVEPIESGEPHVFTLVDVEPDLWWAWDADGSAWLLPAYRFIDDQGGWHVVPAVTDEFLIVVEPDDLPEPEPLPAPEPQPVEAEPEPEPEAPDAVDVRPGTDPEVAAAIFEEYVGLSIEEFTAVAEEFGYSVRVAVQDGESLALTADFIETRVNVAVDGPRVVAVEFIG